MKKLVFCSVFAVFCMGFMWGQTPSDADLKYDSIYNEKVSNYKGFDSEDNLLENKKVYFFEGFDFDNYEPDHPNLTDLNKGEIWAIRYGVKKKEDDSDSVKSAGGQPYSIIGHSQGGLRALGYITQLENYHGIEAVNKIDAVVSMSGATQGIKMLEGGLGGFKKRVSPKVNIVGNGVISLISALISLDPVLKSLEFLLDVRGLSYRNQTAMAVDFITALLPPSIRPYFLEAWNNTNPATIKQIRDMIPRSDYIKKNVAQYTEHQHKVKDGKKLTTEWRYKKNKLGWKIWYLWVGTVDVYKYVTSYEAIPRFNDKVPIGFIVGTDNKTLNMIDDPEKPDLKKNVEETVKGFEIAFAVAEGIHIAKCASIIGLFTGSVTYAIDAEKARSFCENINSEIEKILNTTGGGDGFIALESQYIPIPLVEDPVTGEKKRSHPLLVIEGVGTDQYVEVKQTHKAMEKDTRALGYAKQLINAGYDKRQEQGLR
jgi:hypothetical protein